jgi:MFS family permease
MLLVGMLAWVLRYVLFAVAAPDSIFWMIALGIIVHGICYDFFFVTGQIYIDKIADRSIRAQAQGLLVFATYGVGMLIGAQLAGALYNTFLGEAATLAMSEWTAFWMIMGAMATVVAVIFAFSFSVRAGEPRRPEEAASART